MNKKTAYSDDRFSILINIENDDDLYSGELQLKFREMLVSLGYRFSDADMEDQEVFYKEVEVKHGN